MADKMLKIELKKSLIGRGAKQIATAEALGLKKPGDVTVQPDNAATQGKIAKIDPQGPRHWLRQWQDCRFRQQGPEGPFRREARWFRGRPDASGTPPAQGWL